MDKLKSAVQAVASKLGFVKKLFGSKVFRAAVAAAALALANEYGVPAGFVQALLKSLGLA